MNQAYAVQRQMRWIARLINSGVVKKQQIFWVGLLFMVPQSILSLLTVSAFIRRLTMKKQLLALAILGTLASSAYAAEDFYVGARVGQATSTATGLTKSIDGTLGIMGGYRVNKNFAVEANFDDLGRVYSGAASAKTNVYGLSALGSVAVAERCDVFGKLGYSSVLMSPSAGISHRKNDFSYGLGAQYNLNREVGIRAGWDRYAVGNSAGATSAENVYTVGGIYKF